MVYDFERNRLRQKKIEVKALIALAQYGHPSPVKWKALRALEEIAYPEEVAEVIDGEMRART
tara:strand:- start:567 stop:752 length:186 start_codon:yes stop_codon:yes gene_type:complete